MKQNQKGFAHVVLFLLCIIFVGAIGVVGWTIHQKQQKRSPSEILKSSANAVDKAVAAGQTLSDGHCKGTGPTTFTHLPMDASDFSLLIPYGEVVGGHVTPIDHQYFSPTNFQSAKDTYPVYAMTDATITNIEVHPPENGSNGRIRLVFTVSCTFLYYYDLVTSVEHGIDEQHLPITIKAGQLIGHIGGQTLDFAVWNTQKPLKGFINLKNYDAEPWKVYTADPFPYYIPSLRKIVEDKDPRVAEPLAGKIDYDIDGKLIGNWFLRGSGGYHATTNHDSFYWAGHLSIAPDLYDPSATVVSVGNYDSYPLSGSNFDTSSGDGSAARQYLAKSGSPDPATISQANGIQRFELVQKTYRTPSGQMWDNLSAVKNLKAAPANEQVVGTALVQMTGKRSLKFEVFRGKTAAQVTGFDSNAKTYER
jgi:hypothetical protein